MPLKPPADAKVIRDTRLTLLRVIKTLHDTLVERPDGIAAKIKSMMLEKHADFAESDLVIAALRAGNSNGQIEPRQVWSLVTQKRISVEQFLDCMKVRREQLSSYLSGAEIGLLTPRIPNPTPQLVTEFKPGVEPDLDDLATLLAGAVAKSIPIKVVR